MTLIPVACAVSMRAFVRLLTLSTWCALCLSGCGSVRSVPAQHTRLLPRRRVVRSGRTVVAVVHAGLILVGAGHTVRALRSSQTLLVATDRARSAVGQTLHLGVQSIRARQARGLSRQNLRVSGLALVADDLARDVGVVARIAWVAAGAPGGRLLMPAAARNARESAAVIHVLASST